MRGAVQWVCLALCITSPVGAKFGGVVVLGDSLSDSGNVYNETAQQVPPDSIYHSNGRFSNGHVWVEYLAAALNASLTNLAFGGSHVVGGEPLPTLADQERMLRQRLPDPAALRQFLQAQLVVVADGSNDLIAATQDFNRTGNPSELAAAPGAAANGTRAVVEQLIEDGAAAILVVNVVALDLAPMFALLAPQDAPLIRQAVVGFNAALEAAVAQLAQANPGVQLRVFDLCALGQRLHNQPQSYGLTNVRDPCVLYDYRTTSPFFPNYKAVGACAQPDQYLFFDVLHPTTAVHKWIAASALQALPE